MSGFQAIIRLSRPVNLVIMAGTMYALRFFLVQPLSRSLSLGMELQLSEPLFFLSCVVILFLAAAGNIINDYFDTKVDRINKPERLIVGRLVKRRIAMILHQGLNIAAALLTALVCLYTGRWSALLFPVFMATALWWYSPVLKKKPFVGNLAVALLVSLIPVWTGYFEVYLLRQKYGDMMVDPAPFFRMVWAWLAAYSVFAFVLTLAREAVKDLEDLEGDRHGGYQTLPIVWGVERTVRYVRWLVGATLLLAALPAAWLFLPADGGSWETLLACTGLVLLPLLVVVYLCGSAHEKNQFALISRLLKIAMAGGIAFSWFAGRWILAS